MTRPGARETQAILLAVAIFALVAAAITLLFAIWSATPWNKYLARWDIYEGDGEWSGYLPFFVRMLVSGGVATAIGVGILGLRWILRRRAAETA